MLKNEYETVYITKPDLGDDIQTELQNKLNAVIEKFDGELLVEEKWGRLKMAYEIKNNRHGNYILLDYVGPAELPSQLERVIRLDDRYIRFLTIQLDENVNLEDVREAAQTRHKRRLERMSST